MIRIGHDRRWPLKFAGWWLQCRIRAARECARAEERRAWERLRAEREESVGSVSFWLLFGVWMCERASLKPELPHLISNQYQMIFQVRCCWLLAHLKISFKFIKALLVSKRVSLFWHLPFPFPTPGSRVGDLIAIVTFIEVRLLSRWRLIRGTYPSLSPPSPRPPLFLSGYL